MSRVIQQLTTHQDIINTTSLPSLSYPIKRLTYSEMQQLRDQGLCLSCNNIDTSGHRCPVKRIVLVLPDEDPVIEQQSMVINAPAVLEQLSSQHISLHTLNYASDPKAMQLSTLFYDHQATSLHVLQFGESREKERKSAFGNAQIMFDKILKPTELSLELTKCETSSYAVSIFSISGLSLRTLIVGKRNVFIFDPGGHELKNNETVSSLINMVLNVLSHGMNQMENTFAIRLIAIKSSSKYWRIEKCPNEEIEVFFGSNLDAKGFKSRIPTVLLDKTYTNLEDPYVEACLNLNKLARILGSMLAFVSADNSGVAMMRKCWLKLLMDQVECKLKTIERKVLIFDPGGIFNLECTFDLEDKVVFERSVMIRINASLEDSLSSAYAAGNYGCDAPLSFSSN